LIIAEIKRKSLEAFERKFFCEEFFFFFLWKIFQGKLFFEKNNPLQIHLKDNGERSILANLFSWFEQIQTIIPAD